LRKFIGNRGSVVGINAQNGRLDQEPVVHVHQAVPLHLNHQPAEEHRIPAGQATVAIADIEAVEVRRHR
jgi:hypothetical protein